MHLAQIPVVSIAVFLAIAGVYHLVAPVQSEQLLSEVEPVRAIGAILLVLGSWCTAFLTPITLVIGIPTLLSGLARFAAPRKMIKVNTWMSRYVHGLLMLMGAFGCALLQFEFL